MYYETGYTKVELRMLGSNLFHSLMMTLGMKEFLKYPDF